jgi:hypothetical protein
MKSSSSAPDSYNVIRLPPQRSTVATATAALHPTPPSASTASSSGVSKALAPQISSLQNHYQPASSYQDSSKAVPLTSQQQINGSFFPYKQYDHHQSASNPAAAGGRTTVHEISKNLSDADRFPQQQKSSSSVMLGSLSSGASSQPLSQQQQQQQQQRRVRAAVTQ